MNCIDIGNQYNTDGARNSEMPNPRKATHYNMNYKNRGLALIFNHENFQDPTLTRLGTNQDVACLKPILTKLGFNVLVYTNNNLENLKQHIREAAEYDHRDCDCFVMVVLTHGHKNKLRTSDSDYTLKNLWLPFTAESCPTLAGKPKLFFIQADVEDSKFPSQADFLFSYSSAPGSLSMRNTETGTWFIQALCRELESNVYEYDIVTLLTFVHQRVAIVSKDYIKKNVKLGVYEIKRQIPYVASSLTHLVQFNRKFRTLDAYSGKSDIELSFEPNEIIKNVRPLRRDGWAEGVLNGKIGVFPLNFLEEFVDHRKCSLNTD